MFLLKREYLIFWIINFLKIFKVCRNFNDNSSIINKKNLTEGCFQNAKIYILVDLPFKLLIAVKFSYFGKNLSRSNLNKFKEECLIFSTKSEFDLKICWCLLCLVISLDEVISLYIIMYIIEYVVIITKSSNEYVVIITLF